MLKLRKDDCTYFLCPDADCGLFWKLSCSVPCERGCPRKAKKAIVCWSCKRTIVLPYTHSAYCRVDCKCGASNFQRMSGQYRLHLIKNKTKAKQ